MIDGLATAVLPSGLFARKTGLGANIDSSRLLAESTVNQK